MANLTNEEISGVFHGFDENGVDALNTKSLPIALNLLGIDLTTTEYEETFREAFNNEKRETLTELEFLTFVRQYIGDMDCKKRCMECFGEFVEDKPGCIRLETMKRVLTMMGDSPLDDDVVAELADTVDTDNDGYVEIHKLVDFMYKTDNIGQEININGK